MHLTETLLAGAYVIEPTFIEDDRGSFAYGFRADTFEQSGLIPAIAQVNLSLTRLRGTIRGMHFQVAPHEEAKTVRCVRGAVYDVIVDLRPASPTRCRWFATELTADNRRAIYVPPGFAHGFQSLTDDTEVLYLVSTYYTPSHYRGVRWNDSAFGVEWPLPPVKMHERDRTYPDFVA
jgi:dTDP-4-dehydrorhamnose 3,5-epimerase